MKKYPKDTPVTLEMLAEILDRSAAVTASVETKKMIEPPKPEPKDGEWWLVEASSGWQCVRYYHDTYFWKEYNPELDQMAGAMSLNNCKPIRKVNIEN